MQISLLKTINLDFVHIEIYPDFLITSTKEGIVFDTKELEAIYNVFDNYFPGKDFGLIANRVNDYTVNPTCYLECSKYKRLKGMAILSHNEASYNNAKFEKAFYKDLEVFYTLEECVSFIRTKL
jgi:hypothetical protein